MDCRDCGYFWYDEGEKVPRCHFDGFGLAPCEYEDYECECDDED